MIDGLPKPGDSYPHPPTLDEGMQTITFFGPPLFIMSPRTKIYKAADIKKFKGYLSSFKPEGFIGENEFSYSTTLTIIPEPIKEI